MARKLLLLFLFILGIGISNAALAQSSILQNPSTIQVPSTKAQCPFFPGYSDKITQVALGEYKKNYQKRFVDNKTPYNNYNGNAWCASFASWVYKKAGYSLKAEDNSRDLLEQFASKASLLGKVGVFKDPVYAAPGDVVVWKRPGKVAGHTGIVLQNDCTKGIIKTIEGNMSDQIRIFTYTYKGINTKFEITSGASEWFSLYGFGRWYE